MEELKFEKFSVEEEGVFVSSYKIWNHKRRLIAEVKGQFWSTDKQVYFYNDPSGKNSPYKIVRNSIFWKDFEVHKNGIVQLKFSKEFKLMSNSYQIETVDHGHLSLHGNFWSKDYLIQQNGVEIAKISRQTALFAKDTYGTAIRADYDYRLILCIIIILDIIIDLKRKQSS